MCDVNIATGEVTQFEYDVLLPGRIPWKLIRRYSSINAQRELTGVGWTLNVGTFLRCTDDRVELIVDNEPVATLPIPAVGRRLTVDETGLVVERTETSIAVVDSAHRTYEFPCRERMPEIIRCSCMRDVYKNTLEYEYDRQGRLETLHDSFQRSILFRCDLLSRLVEICIPRLGQTSAHWTLVRYEYDNHDDLVAVVDANGNATKYEYSSHLLTRVTDSCGRDLFYQYDRQRTCVRTWFTGGVWDRQLSYDSARMRVLVTDPHGYSMLYKHNGKGIIIGDVDPLGRVREDVVDDNGRILLRSGAGNGLQTVICRAPESSTAILSQNGVETAFELNSDDQVTKMTDHEGNLWKYDYDGNGNSIRTESPDGAVWQFEYNERGDLIRAVDPLGFERRRERTAHCLTLSDRWGIRSKECYNELGYATSYYDAGGKEIRVEYDSCGNPIQIVNPDGTSSSVQYDRAGIPTVFTDELGRQTVLDRDLVNTRIRIVRADGHEEVFTHCLTDEIATITNSKRETARFTFDAGGRCITIDYWDGRQHSITYDNADNPITLLEGHSNRVLAKCTYENNVLTEEEYYDGRRLVVCYGPSGDVVSIENDDVTLSFKRDVRMRLVTAKSDGLELRFGYNLRSECTSLKSSSGRRIDYQWDGRGRLVKMTDSSSGVYEYSYEARDLVTEIRMPNGCTQRFEYDLTHRMTRRQVLRSDQTELCSRQFVYDAAGQLVSYKDSLRGTRNYIYNAVGFVTSVIENGVVERLRHDSNGNLLTTRDGATIAYGAGDRAISVGSDNLEYDELGNLTAWRSDRGESRFTYTGEGRLKQAVLEDGSVAEYEYDGIARRISKTVNGKRTEFDWNGVHLLGEKTDGHKVEYLFMPGSFFLTGLTRDGRHYSYVCDQLGTPTELIDDQGEIAWAADYSAYGEISVQRVSKVSQPFRFLGQYFDQELSWHYNRYRYYQPRLGCFTCPDPIGFAGGLNLYCYAPNPINWVDPMGLAFATPGAGQTATCEVLSKCSWGPKMMEEAKKKTRGVNEAGCEPDLDNPCDRPPDQKDYLMNNCVEDDKKAKVESSLKSQSDTCKSKQVDHVKEVQCGGANDCDNLEPLTQTVNGSFGSQIKACRNQLVKQGMTGVVTMTIKLVNRRSMTKAQQKNHDKKPCDAKDKPKCP